MQLKHRIKVSVMVPSTPGNPKHPFPRFVRRPRDGARRDVEKHARAEASSERPGAFFRDESPESRGQR